MKMNNTCYKLGGHMITTIFDGKVMEFIGYDVILKYDLEMIWYWTILGNVSLIIF